MEARCIIQTIVTEEEHALIHSEKITNAGFLINKFMVKLVLKASQVNINDLDQYFTPKR